MKSTTIIALVFLGVLLHACGNNNLKDVSADPEFAHLSNNLFFTNQPLYYYQYTKDGGVTTDHFLSLHPNDSNGTKLQDIPEGSHIRVSKVYELTLENGNTLIWITGEVFPSPNQPLIYETALIEGEPFFEERK